MIETSIIIPQRNRSMALQAEVPALYRAMTRRNEPFEVIVVDGGSSDGTLSALTDLQSRFQRLRILRLLHRSGISAALNTGISAASGERIVVTEPGDSYAAKHVDRLLNALVRADMVVGRPRRKGLRKLLHRVGRLPRWLLLGLEVRDPECLFWAARREAVEGVQLTRGMYRYAATLVAARGFRVAEVPVEARLPARHCGLSDGLPNPADLLWVWWLRRRWQDVPCCELQGHEQPVSGNHILRFNGAPVPENVPDRQHKSA